MAISLPADRADGNERVRRRSREWDADKNTQGPAQGGFGLLAVAVLVQLVPYGRDHANPPVTRDAPWPDGRARELATAACTTIVPLCGRSEHW